MTVGEFQQGGSFMLHFDEMVKVMKERSFFSEFKTMIEDAGNKLKELCIIDEEDLANLHQVYLFGVCYNFQKNTIKVYAEPNGRKVKRYEKVISLDSEFKAMKNLDEFLEKEYTKKLSTFEIYFVEDSEFECKTSIDVLQKRMRSEDTFESDEEYFNRMFQKLKSDLEKVGVEIYDLAKENDWSSEFIVD